MNIGISIILFLLAQFPFPGPNSPYSHAATSYKRSITIDHTKCGSANSTDFPLYVYISDATFKTVANGGHVQNSSGSDVLFYTDSGLGTQIASELESYDAANGIVRAWVKVATLSSSADTVIYVSYGVASPPARTSGAWNSNFKGVWHLGDGSTVGTSDSSGNSNTLTNSSGAAVSGKIYGAVSFNGSSQYMYISSPGASLKPATVSVSAWIQWAGDSGTDTAVGIGNGSADSNRAYAFYHSGSTIYGEINSFGQYASTSTVGLGGNWAHIVMTANPSGNVIIYKNGSATTGSSGTTISYTSVDTFTIGRAPSATRYMNGYIDEVHVVGAELTQSWVTSEYNNQNSPSTFFALGAES